MLSAKTGRIKYYAIFTELTQGAEGEKVAKAMYTLSQRFNKRKN